VVYPGRPFINDTTTAKGTGIVLSVFGRFSLPLWLSAKGVLWQAEYQTSKEWVANGQSLT
jgi:hypothetical protein